jgi:hypothetical protein
MNRWQHQANGGGLYSLDAGQESGGGGSVAYSKLKIDLEEAQQIFFAVNAIARGHSLLFSGT